MFSKDFYVQIMNYYTEYKEEYDKKNLIGIDYVNVMMTQCLRIQITKS